MQLKIVFQLQLYYYQTPYFIVFDDLSQTPCFIVFERLHFTK